MAPKLGRKLLTGRSRSAAVGLVLVGLLRFGATPSLSAADDQTRALDRKAAWQWTLEERLSRRFDPEAMKARAAEQAAAEQAFKKGFPEATREFEKLSQPPPPERVDQVTDMIVGRKEPELFLPFELFDHLILMAFAPDEEDRQEERRTIEERVAPLGFGDDLWQRLEKAAAPYLRLERERERDAMLRRATGAPGPPSADPYLLCRTRAGAIKAAKAEFGEAPFLHLLYTGVTRTYSRAYVVTKDLPEELRFIEGGCQ